MQAHKHLNWPMGDQYDVSFDRHYKKLLIRSTVIHCIGVIIEPYSLKGHQNKSHIMKVLCLAKYFSLNCTNSFVNWIKKTKNFQPKTYFQIIYQNYYYIYFLFSFHEHPFAKLCWPDPWTDWPSVVYPSSPTL